MKRQKPETQFAICVRNEDYEASLELRKIYQVIPDATAKGHGYLRLSTNRGKIISIPSATSFR